MIEIFEYVLILIVSVLFAYLAYITDLKTDYVERINKKLRLGEKTSSIFYIGIMSLLMFVIPYVMVFQLNVSKKITLCIVGAVLGICCYSAMNWSKLFRS